MLKQLDGLLEGVAMANGDKNLALNKPAYQSSTHVHPTLPGPQKAVGRSAIACSFQKHFG